MKLRKLIITIIISVAILTALVFVFTRNNVSYTDDVSREELLSAYELLSGSLNEETKTYVDFMHYLDAPCGSGMNTALPTVAKNKDEFATLNYNSELSWEIQVDTFGIYTLNLEYIPEENTYLDYTIAVKVNGEYQYSELKTVTLPLYWEDSVISYQKDRYGDETAPSQKKKEGIYTADLYNNTAVSTSPLPIVLKAGKNTITIKNVSNDGLKVRKLTANAGASDTASYETYIKEFQNENKDVECISINAIDYKYKNSSEIIYEASSNPALTPFDTEYKKLNILSWTGMGDEIIYTFEAQSSGLYKIALHYSNNKEETNGFITIKLDGEVPFRELVSYPLNYTKGGWANAELSDEEGNPYYIYITKGKHEFTLRTEGNKTAEAIRYGQLIAAHCTDFALEIRKISGEDPDKYRTWKMTEYIPEIADYLAAYKTIIQHIRYTLQYESDFGTKSALLTYLDKADTFVSKMAEYPDEIALYTEDLTGKDNSVLVSVSTFTSAMMKESLSLDMIYLYGDSVKIPSAKANVFKTVSASIAQVFHTFTSEKYKVISDNDSEVLTIWVNRALTHVDLLQKLADTEFTGKTGIKVKIAVMPDANKLTLAAAADNTPDVALGLVSYMPFDLACRGALYDLSSFPDFWEVAGRYAAGTMVPYVYNEGIYAIPETMDFSAVIYRTDVFDKLGLTVPGTWDELIKMLPKLQRYGMNFYHNISSGVGYKWFYQTTPLIFQNGGKLYSEDGATTAIDSTESVKGLKRLGELFVAYSLDVQVNEFFNSFRYGTLPVGICDSNTYILIKNGAPELSGQWALAQYPGTEGEDGEISRWFVANGSGAIIFNDTKHAEEAWEFIKWWTDYDTQVEYMYTLRSTYGDTYFWLPSNLEALKQAPINQEDKQIILEMSEWLRDVPRTPGQYLLERSISDIWNKMVLDGESAQVAADEKVIEINREIKKKMQELGYYDEDGNRVKDYVIRDIDWIRENIQKAKEE